jgi:hypothetical protein
VLHVKNAVESTVIPASTKKNGEKQSKKRKEAEKHYESII